MQARLVPGQVSVATFIEAGAPTSHRAFARRAALFLTIGAALYGGAYAAAEWLVYRHAQRNRFFAVRSAPPSRYDHVILGASHSAAFDYQDMNARLERMTGATIMNLSVVGGGISVSRLLLDYFLSRHEAGSIIYVVDSFAFYSREWNEDRLRDRRLFARAPFDPTLAWLLLRNPATLSVALDYAAGFSKINNRDRFAPDVFPDEATRFDRAYRPVDQIDEQRLAFLYPTQVNPAVFRRYLAQFEALVADARSRGLRVVVVKPPIPERVSRMIPGEARFDSALSEVLSRHGVELHDFTHAGFDDEFFYDTDHLNREGVLTFFEYYLKDALLAIR